MKICSFGSLYFYLVFIETIKIYNLLFLGQKKNFRLSGQLCGIAL